MDLVHELCPVQLLEVTKTRKGTISRADWPAYSIWLIYVSTLQHLQHPPSPPSATLTLTPHVTDHTFSTRLKTGHQQQGHNVVSWSKIKVGLNTNNSHIKIGNHILSYTF